LNLNLETHKKYNQFGIRRKYVLNKKRVEKFIFNTEWSSDPSERVFTLRDYKCCYITIKKNKNGNYEPTINGSSVSDYPDVIALPREYNTLNDAKNNALLFVDTVTEKNK
jgi:hypothetical protein